MKIYNVPAKAQATLFSVAEMTPETVKELSDFVGENLESLLSPDTAYELVSAKPLKLIELEEAFRLLDALVPIIFQIVSEAQDYNEVVSDLVFAARRAQHAEGKKLTKSAEKMLRSNLATLFNNQKTRLKSKSLRLLNSHERKFTQCEIITDIRPVFKADGSLSIEAAVVYHTLRLAHTGQDDDFYLALDAQELRVLKKAIERAIKKEESITDLVKKAGIEQVKVS